MFKVVCGRVFYFKLFGKKYLLLWASLWKFKFFCMWSHIDRFGADRCVLNWPCWKNMRRWCPLPSFPKEGDPAAWGAKWPWERFAAALCKNPPRRHKERRGRVDSLFSFCTCMPDGAARAACLCLSHTAAKCDWVELSARQKMEHVFI